MAGDAFGGGFSEGKGALTRLCAGSTDGILETVGPCNPNGGSNSATSGSGNGSRFVFSDGTLDGLRLDPCGLSD
jgi:hypothetical protein